MHVGWYSNATGYGTAVHVTVVLNIGDWSLLAAGPTTNRNSVLLIPAEAAQPRDPLLFGTTSNAVSHCGVFDMDANPNSPVLMDPAVDSEYWSWPGSKLLPAGLPQVDGCPRLHSCHPFPLPSFGRALAPLTSMCPPAAPFVTVMNGDVQLPLGKVNGVCGSHRTKDVGLIVTARTPTFIDTLRLALPGVAADADPEISIAITATMSPAAAITFTRAIIVALLCISFPCAARGR
jgi:hypothetical protein